MATAREKSDIEHMNSAAAGAVEMDALGQKFIRQGFIIGPAENRPALDRLQRFFADTAADVLGHPAPDDATVYLDEIALHVSPQGLNEFRIEVIQRLNSTDWARQAYFDIAGRAIESIVGNELAVQRNFALSIQLPNDDSSLLPTHVDAWSECSPFEMVLWTPFVDCFATKSMFILPLSESAKFSEHLADYRQKGVEALFRDIESQVVWLDVPFGSYLLFNPTLIHGNRINREDTTRWSLNRRFKGLFTPYSDKRLGSFFEVFSMRPATRAALSYRLPEGFHD